METRNLSTSDPLSGGLPEPAAVAKATANAATSDQDDLFGSLTQPAAPEKSTVVDPLGTSGASVSASSKVPAKTAAVKSSPPDDDLFGEVKSESPTGGSVEGKPSAKPPLGKKEVREDKERGSDHLFSSEPVSEASPAVSKPSPSPKVSRPKPKSGGLFDDEGSDDDLFSSPTKKSGPPVKKPPAGAVPLFDGVDPFAEKSTMVVDPLGIAGASVSAGSKVSGRGGDSQLSGGRGDLYSSTSSSESQKLAVSRAERLTHSRVT